MIKQTTVFLNTVFLRSEFKLENIYFGVNVCGKNVCGKFHLREFIFADRWRIAKITTSKNFVPHGTSQTVLIRDIDNTWSFFKNSRSRVTSPPVCMQATSLENQKKRNNEIFP